MIKSLENILILYKNHITSYEITRGNRMGGMKSKVITVEYIIGNIIHITEFALNKESVPSFISRKDQTTGVHLDNIVYDQTLEDFEIAVGKTLSQ